MEDFCYLPTPEPTPTPTPTPCEIAPDGNLPPGFDTHLCTPGASLEREAGDFLARSVSTGVIEVNTDEIEISFFDGGTSTETGQPVIDGDRIRVVVDSPNNQAVVPAQLSNYVLEPRPGETFTLKLETGRSIITIQALNEGAVSLNTPGYSIKASQVVSGLSTGVFNLSLHPFFLNLFSEGIIEIEVPEKICDPDKFETWANSIAFPAPNFANPNAARRYEAYRCGRIQYAASVGDVSVNADGADTPSCRLLECKYTGGGSNDFFVKCEPDFIRDDIEDEFERYGVVISDPNTPVVGLLVKTNKDVAIPCLTQMLAGRVSKFSISVEPEEPEQA